MLPVDHVWNGVRVLTVSYAAVGPEVVEYVFYQSFTGLIFPVAVPLRTFPLSSPGVGGTPPLPARKFSAVSNLGQAMACKIFITKGLRPNSPISIT